jgi:hypothetical protein
MGGSETLSLVAKAIELPASRIFGDRRHIIMFPLGSTLPLFLTSFL